MDRETVIRLAMMAIKDHPEYSKEIPPPDGEELAVFERFAAAVEANCVPPGWKVVPIEPTDKMIRAMEDECMRSSCMDMAKREYKAMLAAAPAPKEES